MSVKKRSPRRFVSRSASEVREAAARLCLRMVRNEVTSGDSAQPVLEMAAARIRRIPVAGFLKKKPR